MKIKNLIQVSSLGLVISCAGPQANYNLNAANDEYLRAAADPKVTQLAPVELKKAKLELDEANKKWQDEVDQEILEHQIYMARNKIALAKEKAAIKYADHVIEQSQSDRDAILIKAKEMKIKKLSDELAELSAKKSDRGTVVTLSNVLFAVDKANLLPGAQRQIDQLAEFLDNHSDRRVSIEGFTDSTGSDEYNYILSQRRAEAVARALNTRGIGYDRIKTIGYGEAYPVASNDSASGRQQNRRVEIIISNPGEKIKERSS